jgi:hypothetical protein
MPSPASGEVRETLPTLRRLASPVIDRWEPGSARSTHPVAIKGNGHRNGGSLGGRDGSLEFGGDILTEREFYTHTEPVWRRRANFIIHARVDPDEADGRADRPDAPEMFEQLWTRRVRRIGKTRFEICCIPFFVYGVNLGDHVETESHGDLKFVVKRVAQWSGHSTFRLWFGESSYSGARDEVVDELSSLGCELEWSSENLLAVDAASMDLAKMVADIMRRRQALGHFVGESGGAP